MIEVAGLMVRVVSLGEITGVAGEAKRRSLRISTAMAGLALEADVGAFERKSGERVIVAMRVDRNPSGSAMATGTGVSQAVSHVIGIGRAGVRHLVAGVTIIGSIGIACAMAGLAFEINVGAGDRESGLVMIEFGRLPRRSSVALDAIVAEVGGFVIGVVGGGKISAVTRVAISRCADITAAVATLAIQSSMRTCEGKVGGIMVEICRLPGIEVVTSAAVMIEVPCRMVRLFGLRKCGVMTAITISGSSCIGIAVAILTLDRLVGTLESK